MAYVEKLPSGKYRGVATWKDMYGKKKRKSFTDESEKKALRKAERYEEDRRALQPTGTTLAQALDAYINSLRPVLSPSTLKGYKSAADSLTRNHPRLCSCTELPRELSQALVNELLGRGLSPKTVHNYIGVVSAACKYSGIPYQSPKLPQWILQDSYAPTEEDVKRILAEVKGTPMEIPITLGIFGLRRSEISGLSADDLDGNLLHIHAARVYGEDGLALKKTTKTRLSTRTIQITDHLADLIREAGSVDMTPAAISSAFRRITRRLGIEMPFKTLRSFFASYCHGVLHLSDAQIQQLGGWSKSMVMRRHYIKSMENQAAADAVTAAVNTFFD